MAERYVALLSQIKGSEEQESESPATSEEPQLKKSKTESV